MRAKRLVAAALALALSGCMSAEGERATSNPDATVEKLFTVDGCTVYRFYDYGARHFVTCTGGVMHHQSSGKTSTVFYTPTVVRLAGVGGWDRR